VAKCLVLGGNGFIGSHIIDSLVEKGHTVRVFDRFKTGVSESMFNPSERIEPFPGDFLNRGDLSNAVEGMDYVFHFISTTTPASAENDPLIDIETNMRMSVELFQECVSHGVKKVIFASTGGAIYGNSRGRPLAEDTVTRPTSPYAIGKLTIEHYLRYFKVKHGLESVTYRLSNPYGERQSLAARQGVIPIFLQRIAAGEPITILGDGSMVRDYIYVKDAAAMIVASFESATKHVYNLGSGQGVTVNELVASMKKITKRNVICDTAPIPSTFVDRVVLDVRRFQEEFPIRPKIGLEEGIQKTWKYVLKARGGK
jgi:UDP-glucose 4-epimerase